MNATTSLRKHGLVKFLLADQVHFGTVLELDPKANEALVGDVLQPLRHRLPTAALTPFDCASGLFDECQAYLDQDYRAAREQARRLPKGKVVVGKIFAIGVADGQAWYLITRVGKNGKTCALEWRGWGGLDGYTDHHFGYRAGNVPVAQVAKYVRVHDGLDELFG